METKVIRATTETGKVLMAQRNPEHTANKTSVERCVAACAYYLLRQYVEGEQFATKDNGFQLAYYGNKVITNSLADAHGIPRDTMFYYLYNIGLEFLAEKFPMLVASLLVWRSAHRDLLFKTTSTHEDYYNDLRQATVYYEAVAETRNMTQEALFADYASKIIENGVSKYLLELKPQMTSSRSIRAIHEQRQRSLIKARVDKLCLVFSLLRIEHGYSYKN